MPLVFRSMLRDGDGPQVAPKGDSLGVRVPPAPHPDVHPDGDGQVLPGRNEGMSVAPDWRLLPNFLIPRRLKKLAPKATGNNARVCWKMGAGAFEPDDVADGLRLEPDHANHGVISPAEPMHVDEFQHRIAATRAAWEMIPEEREPK